MRGFCTKWSIVESKMSALNDSAMSSVREWLEHATETGRASRNVVNSVVRDDVGVGSKGLKNKMINVRNSQDLTYPAPHPKYPEELGGVDTSNTLHFHVHCNDQVFVTCLN